MPTKFPVVACCFLLVYSCWFAGPENHVEIWLACLFLSREKFHAKQIFVLSRPPPLGPQFESHHGHSVDWVFSPYLTAWVFPGIILWGFPPTSKTEFLHCLLASRLALIRALRIYIKIQTKYRCNCCTLVPICENLVFVFRNINGLYIFIFTVVLYLGSHPADDQQRHQPEKSLERRKRPEARFGLIQHNKPCMRVRFEYCLVQ